MDEKNENRTASEEIQEHEVKFRVVITPPITPRKTPEPKLICYYCNHAESDRSLEDQPICSDCYPIMRDYYMRKLEEVPEVGPD
jgi:hypothetical protein